MATLLHIVPEIIHTIAADALETIPGGFKVQGKKVLPIFNQLVLKSRSFTNIKSAW